MLKAPDCDIKRHYGIDIRFFQGHITNCSDGCLYRPICQKVRYKISDFLKRTGFGQTVRMREILADIDTYLSKLFGINGDIFGAQCLCHLIAILKNV